MEKHFTPETRLRFTAFFFMYLMFNSDIVRSSVVNLDSEIPLAARQNIDQDNLSQNILPAIERPREPTEEEIIEGMMARVTKFKPFIRGILRNPSARTMFRPESFVTVGAPEGCRILPFESMLIRNHYKQRVLHSISYRTFARQIMVPKLGQKYPNIDMEVVSEGRIYHYAVGIEALKHKDILLAARIKYASLLLGIMSEHRWVKHVTPDPVKGLKILLDLLKFNELPKSLIPYENIVEIKRTLAFLKNGYGVLMNLAFSAGNVVDRKGLRAAMHKYTQVGDVIPMCSALRDFFIDLFDRRQIYLREQLPKIATRNGVLEDEVLEAISMRHKLLKLPAPCEEMLILNSHAVEYYAIEAILYVKELKDDV